MSAEVFLSIRSSTSIRKGEVHSNTGIENGRPPANTPAEGVAFFFYDTAASAPAGLSAGATL